MTLPGRLWIRIFDFCIAICLLLPGLLLFLLILPVQLVVFRGQVLFFQQRSGRFGKSFTYTKLVSMKALSPGSRDHGRVQLQSTRIGGWGRFLRRYHLDELPEILYIIAGKMSFVGPRPLMIEHEMLVTSPARRSCKPGWTGTSQLFLISRKVLPSRIQRRLDADMAHQMSVQLYLRILSATVIALLQRHRRSDLSRHPGQTVLDYRQNLEKEQRHD